MTARNDLLHGPVAPQLLRLAAPVLVVLTVQTLVGVAETWFVATLGTAPVAGVALVFPVFMLMMMMSNGGIGGGVSSAIARALGAGRRGDAGALAFHALALALGFGTLFSLAAWFGGRGLYAALGGRGATLENALLYSGFVFAGAIPAWITALLASALRGAGEVRVPAAVSIGGAALTLVLSPLLIFGWGPVPGLGVAGAGIATIVFNVLASAVLAGYMRSARSPLRLEVARFEGRLFAEILRVGLLSAIGTLSVSLTVVAATGLTGRFGADAIAGYGLASRLDQVLIPILFALGTACVTMVGMSVGAGRHERARSVAWTSALISVLITGVIGAAAAIAPQAWMGLFSREAAVLGVGNAYLSQVAPFYPFIGLGMALYFAAQGAGRMVAPFLAGLARLAVVLAGGGVWVIALHGSLEGLFWIIGAAQATFGLLNAGAMLRPHPFTGPNRLGGTRTG
jgi:putative MATE family efflux protein